MLKMSIVQLILILLISCKNDVNQEPIQPKRSTNINLDSVSVVNISNSNFSNENEPMFTEGVLRIKTDEIQEKADTVFLYNSDNTLFGKIYSVSESEEPVFVGQSPLNIRAYYPDYYVIIFDSYKLMNNKYKVLVDGKEKYIPYKDNITVFENWKTHMKTSFIITDKENPLRKAPNDKSEEIKGEYDYSMLSFEVLEIKDEWIKVICNKDCEGCPNQKKITGWIRWKNGNQIKVKLYYIC